MNVVGFNMHIYKRHFLYLALSAMLMGCAADNDKADSAHKLAGKTGVERDTTRHADKLFGEPIFTLNKKKIEEEIGIGVNSYLWRASLDTFSFMPFQNVEPFSGVITTDWHSPPGEPNQRMKINAVILDRQLRADGIKIALFHQTYDAKKGWVAVPVAPETVEELVQTVLTRARQLKIQSKIN